METTLTTAPAVAALMETEVAIVARPTLPRPREVLDWIRSLSAPGGKASSLEDAPVDVGSCPSLVDEINHGSLYICSYGHTLALAFHGPGPFILRWYNWAVNTGVIGSHADLNWYLGKPVEGDDTTVSLAYICPKKREDILRGLALQFRWEIIRDREVAPLEDRWDKENEAPVLTLNDTVIDRLAADRAAAFMVEHVRTNSLILARPRDVGHVYDLARQGRAESGWGWDMED